MSFAIMSIKLLAFDRRAVQITARVSRSCQTMNSFGSVPRLLFASLSASTSASTCRSGVTIGALRDVTLDAEDE